MPAPSPPWIRRDFFLAVDGDIASDVDWARLVAAYERLDELSAPMRDQPGFAYERSTFELVLWREAPSPTPIATVGISWFG